VCHANRAAVFEDKFATAANLRHNLALPSFCIPPAYPKCQMLDAANLHSRGPCCRSQRTKMSGKRYLCPSTRDLKKGNIIVVGSSLLMHRCAPRLVTGRSSDIQSASRRRWDRPDRCHARYATCRLSSVQPPQRRTLVLQPRRMICPVPTGACVMRFRQTVVIPARWQHQESTTRIPSAKPSLVMTVLSRPWSHKNSELSLKHPRHHARTVIYR